jgi:hypothetical protein
MKSKKTIALFMLMIGFSSISTQTTDLYALVYPSSTGPLSNLYNSNATAQDEIDKFLNNKPSLLDASNPAASGAIGLGTRKLYLFCIVEDGFGAKYMGSTGANAYIYYDTTAGCAKIHYHEPISAKTNDDEIYSTGELQYKKVLVDSDTATDQGWIEMSNTYYLTAQKSSSRAYIKIKTSDENADQGGTCTYGDATLKLLSITISGYKMLIPNDYFLPVYQTSITATTAA